MSEHVRLFVSFPEELVDRPMIYEMVKRFDVVPNIRRANVGAALGLGDPRAHRCARTSSTPSIAYLEEVGCTVNTMEGDVIEG